MAPNTKQPGRPEAESVDREPSGEPTPQHPGPPVDPEDEPKGQPTSDRFQTETAQRPSKHNAKKH